MPTPADVAGLLDRAARLLGLLAEERRAGAWARAARAIAALDEDPFALLEDGRLRRVRGVGGETLRQLRVLAREGRLPVLEEAEGRLPPGLPPLLDLPGLSPARLATLAGALAVTSAADLEHACLTNRVRDLPGFGREVQQALRSALLRGAGWGRARLLDAGRRAAARVLDRLQREPAALRLAVAGAVRRMEPVVEEVALLATAHDPDALLGAFASLPFVARVLERGRAAARVRLEGGEEVVLDVVQDEAAFGARLACLTGPEGFTAALAARAGARGMRLGEDGLARGAAGVPTPEEEDLFDRLGLPWCPPERRHALAPGAQVPDDLVGIRDVRGLVGLHTDRGAGTFPPSDMLERAAREGYAWAAVLDRSPDAFPRGASAAALRETAAALAARAAGDGPPAPPALAGVLADVLPDGTLDLPPGLEAALDLVVAAADDVLAAPGAGRAETAARLLAAAKDPRAHALLWPMGGVVLGRPAAAVDPAPVLDALAATGKALAISGLPHRLLVAEEVHAGARARGVPLLPLADAHDLGGVDQGIYALAAARRGGWRREEVLVTRSADDVRAWARGVAGGRA